MESLRSRKLQPYQSFLLITAVMIIFFTVQTVGIFFLGDNLYLYQTACEVLGLAVPVLLYMLFTGRFKDNVHFKKVSGKNILIILAVVILFIPVSMLLATFDTWIVDNLFGTTPGLEDIVLMENFGDYLKSILVIALVPAICEEIAFRTAFMSGLERLGKVGCFFFCSLFFSLAHSIPEKLLSTFALSVLLCYFLYRTGSLLAAMIGHFINNFIALTITYATRNIPPESGGIEFLQAYGLSEYGVSFIVLGAISLLVLPVIVILLRRFRKNTESTKINIIKETKLDSNGKVAFLVAFTIYIIPVAIIIVTNALSGFQNVK